MADLPEWEQVNTSFDTLYTLANKLEVRRFSHSEKVGSGSTDAYRDRCQRYPAPMGRIATLEDEELFPPDPEIWGAEAPEAKLPEFGQIEGLNLWMTQAMNHYQHEEHRCFMCGATDHFAQDCPHLETFCAWQGEHLNYKALGLKNKELALTNPPPPCK